MLIADALTANENPTSRRDTRRPGTAAPDSVLDAAVSLAGAGWPVLPTRPPAFGELVTTRPPSSCDEAAEWWAEAYGLACRTGDLFDVLQVPAMVGEEMLATATSGPVLRMSPAAWPVAGCPVLWFLVTPGHGLIPDFPRTCPVRLIGDGQWIPLPPTPYTTDGGSVRWAHVPEPAVMSLRSLPHSLQLQWTAMRALVRIATLLHHHGPGGLPGRLLELYHHGASVGQLAELTGHGTRAVTAALRRQQAGGPPWRA